MGRRFRDLVAAFKDTAALSLSYTAAAAASPTAAPTSPHLAVLRATTHHPSPPSPHHIAALLAFGHHSRLSAAALVAALTARLAAARTPTVAFKALLAIHHLLARSSFILLDSLSAALRSRSRNPLNLSSFRDASSPAAWLLSDWVRWYARFLESLLSINKEHLNLEYLSGLINPALLGEIEALVRVAEEVAAAPEASPSPLVWEAVRLVEEDRITVERGIAARVREARERFGSFRFGDMVELVCLGRRLERCRGRPAGGVWRVKSSESEVSEVMTMAEEVVVEEEKGRVGRGRLGVSARMPDRVLETTVSVRFGSSRWVAVDR